MPDHDRPALHGQVYEEARQAEKARRLFKAADDVPALIDRLGGGLGKRVRERLIGRIDSDPLARESVRRQAEVMCRDLEGPNPTAIERLIVERVVVGWLALARADLLCEAFGYGPDGREVGGYCLRMRGRGEPGLPGLAQAACDNPQGGAVGHGQSQRHREREEEGAGGRGPGGRR